MVDEGILDTQLTKYATKTIPDEIKHYNLTPLHVARALNIIPKFVSSSIFSTIKDKIPQPSIGYSAPVSYQVFLVAIRGGQRVLAGTIDAGQQNIIQVKDLVPKSARTPCV